MSASIPSFIESPVDLPAPAVVQTYNLTKTYRTGFWLNQLVTPLSQCNLSVQPGETFGLLGPNGAGKTTLLKLLLGIVRPTSGRATVLGQPVGDRTVKHRVGYLPENAYFYDYLTGQELLRYTAGLFGLSARQQRQRIAQLLDMVGLDPQTIHKKPLKKYSKGMLQRVGLAQAIINDPDIVLLDEPMSGLDPTGRFRVREVIMTLKEKGKTIFFNSHVLSDVEAICDRVAILDRGELLCVGTLDELLGGATDYHIAGRGGNLEVLEKWLTDLKFQQGLWHGTLNGEPYDFLSSLRGMGGEIIDLQLARNSLEEFFLKEIGKNREP
ncbi:MAG: ABC transporter ATP-binding protein [Cyanobacteria bacterium P01_C01_bin.70]